MIPVHWNHGVLDIARYRVPNSYFQISSSLSESKNTEDLFREWLAHLLVLKACREVAVQLVRDGVLDGNDEVGHEELLRAHDELHDVGVSLVVEEVRVERAVGVELVIDGNAALAHGESHVRRVACRVERDGERPHEDEECEEDVVENESRDCTRDAYDAERPEPVRRLLVVRVLGSFPAKGALHGGYGETVLPQPFE